MATKSVDFTHRLIRAITESGLKNPAFAKKATMGYSTLMNYLKPKNIGHVPEWDQLIKIAKAAERSVDWLLTGEEFNGIEENRLGYNKGDHPCIIPKEICEQVKDIVDSDHPVIKPALLSNLAAFQYSVKKEKEDANDKALMKKQIKELQKAMQEGRHTGIEAVTSSNTGKRGT